MFYCSIFWGFERGKGKDDQNRSDFWMHSSHIAPEWERNELNCFGLRIRSNDTWCHEERLKTFCSSIVIDEIINTKPQFENQFQLSEELDGWDNMLLFLNRLFYGSFVDFDRGSYLQLEMRALCLLTISFLVEKIDKVNIGLWIIKLFETTDC